VLTGIDDGNHRYLRALTARFDGLGASRMRKKGEVREMAEGLYRGVCLEWGLGLGLGRRSIGKSAPVHAQVSWPELGDDLTGGPHMSMSGERGSRYPFGKTRCWASGRNEVWAGLVPLGPFLIFILFHFLFPFFDFYLFHTFANLFQINSNKFLNYLNLLRKVLNQ
jgi:hypothetical protein